MEHNKLLINFLEENFDLRFFTLNWVSPTRVKVKEKKGHNSMTFFVRDGLIKNGCNRYYQQARNGVFIGFNKP